MKNHLIGLERQVLQVLKDIGQEADSIPVNAYVVGGLVRDIFLKKRNLDLDIVVEGEGTRLAHQYASRASGSLVVHERFGTATVHLKNGWRVDFATARREEYPTAGALPVVQPGFISDDLFRRDFTINAMAIRLNKDRFGELVDEFGGLKDLKNKKIRILHDQSFKDDPTRILRAVRFEQRLHFSIEPRTLNLLRIALKKDYPLLVKPERYFVEFRKILREPEPLHYLRRLQKFGGLKFLAHKLTVDLKSLRTIQRHVIALRKRIAGEPADTWWFIYLMGLVHHWPLASLKQMCERFNLRRIDRESLLYLPQVSQILTLLKKKGLPHSEVFKILKPLSNETILFLRSFCQHKIIHKRLDHFLEQDRHVSLHVNGEDLKRLGLQEGQKIKIVLDSLLYKKIDGIIKTTQDELREAQRLVSQM